jgi:hypothetical protein
LSKDRSLVFKSQIYGSGKINDLEFEAINKAVNIFNEGIIIYSDNLPAVHRAKKTFKKIEIRHINGKDNPAHKLLCGLSKIKKPMKKKIIKKKKVKEKVFEEYDNSRNIPIYMRVMTLEGERFMSYSKFKKYVRYMQKKYYLRKEEQNFK